MTPAVFPYEGDSMGKVIALRKTKSTVSLEYIHRLFVGLKGGAGSLYFAYLWMKKILENTIKITETQSQSQKQK